jgi:alpha-D-xyloside xylohydrolase
MTSKLGCNQKKNAKERKVLGRFDAPPFDWHGSVDGTRIIWEDEGELMWLEPYGRNCLRFRSSKNIQIHEDLTCTLLPPGENQALVEGTEETAVIRNAVSMPRYWGWHPSTTTGTTAARCCWEILERPARVHRSAAPRRECIGPSRARRCH